MSKAFFTLATACIVVGAYVSIMDSPRLFPPSIAGLGTMAMNSYYLLAIALYAAAAAAELIWPSKR